MWIAIETHTKTYIVPVHTTPIFIDRRTIVIGEPNPWCIINLEHVKSIRAIKADEIVHILEKAAHDRE
jgi:hypothetical protein